MKSNFQLCLTMCNLFRSLNYIKIQFLLSFHFQNEWRYRVNGEIHGPWMCTRNHCKRDHKKQQQQPFFLLVRWYDFKWFLFCQVKLVCLHNEIDTHSSSSSENEKIYIILTVKLYINCTCVHTCYKYILLVELVVCRSNRDMLFVILARSTPNWAWYHSDKYSYRAYA